MYVSLAGQKVENTTLKDAANRLEKIIAQGNLYLYPLLRNGESKNLSRSHHVLTFEIVPSSKRLLTPTQANETETICVGNVISIFGDKTPFKLSTHEEKYIFGQLLDIATCLTLAGANVYIPSSHENHYYPPISHYPLVLFDPDQAERAEFVVPPRFVISKEIQMFFTGVIAEMIILAILIVIGYFIFNTWHQVDALEARCLSYDEQIRFLAKELAALKPPKS